MLRNIYLGTAFFSLHSYLVIYINSSFLGEYFNNSELGVLYIVGAVINLVLLSLLPRIITKIGIHRSTIIFIAIESIATLGMIVSGRPWSVAVSFTLHEAMILMILFMFDEYLEHASKTEEYTGRIRSVYLTISSVLLVASPIIAGAVAGGAYGFKAVYSLSLVFLIPLFFLIWKKMGFKNGTRSYVGIRQALLLCVQQKSSGVIVLCRFFLESFYAWMVIYMAIYLTKFVGFEWKEVGALFTIMLLPFVLFQIPLGSISDKFRGEKWIIFFGFVIAGSATLLVPLTNSTDFLLWAFVLFMTRVGASFAEIGTESFFFKHVKEKDTGMISLFRATRPLSYIVAPAIATITFSLVSYQNAFFVLAGMVFLGALTAFALKDTE